MIPENPYESMQQHMRIERRMFIIMELANAFFIQRVSLNRFNR